MAERDTPSLEWTGMDEQALDRHYADWAARYDADLREGAGYRVPEVAVELLAARCPVTDATILDAGAGTGIVGELLHGEGYRAVHGLDMSPAMLAQAAAKGVYASLQQATLGEPLDLATDRFDAVVAVGLFGPTHAPAHAFDELIRVTRPGGHVVFTMRTDEVEPNNAFGRRVADSTRWRQVDQRGPFIGFARGRADLRFWAWAFEVSGR